MSDKGFISLRLSLFVIILLARFSTGFAAEEIPAFDAQIQVIGVSIQEKELAQAQAAVDQFWAAHSGEEGFVDAVRQIKDTYWTNEAYAEHFALCERIVSTFPDDPLSIGIQADRVTGYIAQKDLTRAAEEQGRFWDLYSRDERFVDVARRIKDQYWWGGYYAEHFEFCEELIALFPDHPLSVGLLGDQVNAYVILKEPEKAAATFERFWTQYSGRPEFVEKLKNIKDICWWNENYALHFSLCKRFVTEFPEHPSAMGLQADAVGGYVSLNDPNNAADELERFWGLYETHPDFIKQVRQINDVCWWHKRYPLYFSICERVVEAFPEHPLSVGMLADEVIGYVLLREPENAAAKLDAFWTKYSTAPDFLEKLKQIKDNCWWHENYALHFTICERVAGAFPDNPQTMQVRADEVTGYLDRGDLEKAEALVQQFLSEPHTGDEYLTFMNPVANQYNLKGHYPKADALYQYALDAADAGDGRLAITKMGQLASRIAESEPNRLQQQFDQVLTDYADDPNLVKGALLAAEVYYHLGQKGSDADVAAADYEGGIRLLQKTMPNIRNDQDLSEACYLRGLCHWQLEDWFASASALRESIEANPQHTWAGSMHWLVSDCYEKLMREGAVRTVEAEPVIEWGYQTLFEKYPNSPDVDYAAVRMAEINLARGKPVTAAVYINWFLDHTAFGDPRRKKIIHRLAAGLEVCDQ